MKNKLVCMTLISLLLLSIGFENFVYAGFNCTDKPEYVKLCGNGHGNLLSVYKIVNSNDTQAFWLYSYDQYPYKINFELLKNDIKLLDMNFCVSGHKIIPISYTNTTFNVTNSSAFIQIVGQC